MWGMVCVSVGEGVRVWARVCEFGRGSVSLGEGLSVFARICKCGCESVWATV